jgi:hypothetical protein
MNDIYDSSCLNTPPFPSKYIILNGLKVVEPFDKNNVSSYWQFVHINSPIVSLWINIDNRMNLFWVFYVVSKLKKPIYIGNITKLDRNKNADIFATLIGVEHIQQIVKYLKNYTYFQIVLTNESNFMTLFLETNSLQVLHNSASSITSLEFNERDSTCFSHSQIIYVSCCISNKKCKHFIYSILVNLMKNLEEDTITKKNIEYVLKNTSSKSELFEICLILSKMDLNFTESFKLFSESFIPQIFNITTIYLF